MFLFISNGSYQYFIFAHIERLKSQFLHFTLNNLFNILGILYPVKSKMTAKNGNDFPVFRSE
jgi:hypothetical protein